MKINLPEMPIASKETATELKELCKENKCTHLNEWLNRLYAFRVQYLIYKEELAK